MDLGLLLVLLFTIFIIFVTQKLVLQQYKNVTAKCMETLSPPPTIQYLLATTFLRVSLYCTVSTVQYIANIVQKGTDLICPFVLISQFLS